MKRTLIVLTLLLSAPAMRAAMEHNLAWFNQYVWGERPGS